MMAIRLQRNRQKDRIKTSKVRLSERPASGPAIRPAKKMPVPGVESHVTSKRAGSANGFAVTGGTRITWRWRPGTGCFHDVLSSTLLTEGSPQITTKAESSTKGIHAASTRPKVRWYLAAAASPA